MGKSFYNLNLGPINGPSEPGRLSSLVRGTQGGGRGFGDRADCTSAAAWHGSASHQPMPARLPASPGLHSFAGNEDVGDPRQV